MGSPLVASSHLVRVPHDSSHLPERFGLFSIILLGEAMVAVMTGMSRQESWSLGGASAAILGMVLVFTIWWWYFDGVDAVAERRVRSARDVARFHAWSYAHLPLYLGIAVTGVGIEHVITAAIASPLHAEEAWILCGAVVVVMMALTVIGATHEGRPRLRVGATFAQQIALVTTALLLGVSGSRVMPPLFITGLCLICIAQLGLALGASSAHSRTSTTGC
jgi:low temperature requirement protein LtrA